MLKVEKLLRTPGYKIIKQEYLPDGKWVSTVWLGLDHNWDGGKPLIFETMVFPSHEGISDLDCKRYSTLAQAKKGHKAIVEKWRKKSRII